MPAPAKIFLLHLELKDIRPPIWRQILVSSHTTLAQLHRIIQVLMGWYNYHLYMFRIGGIEHAPPHPDDEFYGDRPESVRTRLSSHLRRTSSHVAYEYDLGDGWQIRITLKRIYDDLPTEALPMCVGGQRHGPLEDSGGPPGYQDLLQILADPHHDEYQSMHDWAPEDFDSEEFSIETANVQLHEEFRRRHR